MNIVCNRFPVTMEIIMFLNQRNDIIAFQWVLRIGLFFQHIQNGYAQHSFISWHDDMSSLRKGDRT